MKELIAKSAVTEKMILFSNERVKDGQKFVTTEGSRRPCQRCPVQQDDPNAEHARPKKCHSLTNLIKTQVGKE